MLKELSFLIKQGKPRYGKYIESEIPEWMYDEIFNTNIISYIYYKNFLVKINRKKNKIKWSEEKRSKSELCEPGE